MFIDGAFFLAILIAVFGGSLSFLSPCVLPLVPPYLSYLVGASIDQIDNKDVIAKRKLVFSALLFVMGFSTVFIALGASTSLLGQFMQQYKLIFVYIAGALIIFMGLHFVGLFKIAFLNYELRYYPMQRSAGLLGAYVIGLAFAFGWTPCIGPILGTILAFAADYGNSSYGKILLAAYSVGLGIPFLLSAVFIRQFIKFTGKIRRYMGIIERIMGLFLILTGILFITGGINQIGNWLVEIFPNTELIDTNELAKKLREAK